MEQVRRVCRCSAPKGAAQWQTTCSMLQSRSEQVEQVREMTELETQLVKSLWALAGQRIAVTSEVANEHIPHFGGSNERIRKVAVDTVAILCPCKAVLVFWRCGYIYDGGERTPADFTADIMRFPPAGTRCDEEISERRHLSVNNRCVFHD